MVMKQKVMTKNLLQSIRRSIGRYIAIAVIIALGGAMFVGLRSTKMDMVATGQVYMRRQNMFDLRLISPYGWSKDQPALVRQLEGVADAEGQYYTDLIAARGEDGEGAVYRFHTIPERVDRLVLLQGRMPEAPDECLADGFRNGAKALGTKVIITDDNDEDALDNLNCRSFTIVGIVSSPLYMDMNRGNTSVGSGNISNYFFVPEEAFDADYYTEIHVTIPGEYAIYSKAYGDAMEEYADLLKPQLEPLADDRLRQVRKDAEKAFDDGMREYEDGLQEYEEEKADAEQKLRDAFQGILDGQDELRRSEEQLISGEQQIRDGWETISNTKKTLAQSRQTLASARTDSLQEISAATVEAMSSFQNISAQKQDADSKTTQAGLELAQAEARLLQLQFSEAPDPAAVAEATAQRDACQQNYNSLQADSNYLGSLLTGIERDMLELAAKQVAMEQQFAAAEGQIAAGESQIAAFETELSRQEKVIADGWIALEKGKEEWKLGYKEYADAKAEAREQFDDAEAELADAAQKLEDARQKISDMTENEIYVLDRTTNLGYNSLDSASDIVAGVSRVFPVFFLAVAALVCITTMSRMVDEERTQIGTLKALGYSSLAIMSKYLIYAGSGAVIGGILGVAAGSIIFPVILWEAYKIMIFISPNIVLRFDWVQALAVIGVYTASMLLVTWYCCYKSLAEVPAELIRPKAPAAGKKLLMEHLPIWNRMSFLNKVAARNIFRYRQRLAMMLLGIGGCTALLMTGFGLRDSISKIVDVQYAEVMHYDMEVYFRDAMTQEQQQDFRGALSGYASDILFFEQISCEISAQDQTRSLYLISAEDQIADFIDFHRGDVPTALPGQDEVLLSAGIADILGLSVGDDIIMRDPDLQELQLRVSGIYDNHVFNFAIVSPDTIRSQWGEEPELQMAFIKNREGVDPYAAGAEATNQETVMNVTVSEQQAEMVAAMMKALDLVVIVVVVCAGLLAVIVLYNLTNININERIREIATIKVLGFNAMEAAMYVFKENLVLSIMGTVLGIPLGKLLLGFVISQIRIDMIWLKARLELPSLLISVVLTILSAIVVDMIFYFKLEEINMAEALKSVE